MIDRVVFYAEERTFCILKVILSDGSKAPITVLAELINPQPGDVVDGDGTWVNDPVHGAQIRAKRLHRSAPTTVDGIARYLSSGVIPGIGTQIAKTIIDAFGTSTLNVLARQPEKVAALPGIGKRRMELIRGVMLKESKDRELQVFLQGLGIGGGERRLRNIQRRYGADACDVIRNDPYRLARDIDGVGFKTADVIAERLGVPRNGMVRAKASVYYALQEATKEGHCALPDAVLHARLAEQCPECSLLLEEAITSLEAEKLVVRDQLDGEPVVFLPQYFAAEEAVQRGVSRLLSVKPSWCIDDIESRVSAVSKELGFTLNSRQLDAVHSALHGGLTIITGCPGTGKTALVRVLTQILRRASVRFLLCAPTGRAAKRLSSVTGEKASTLHRLLGFQGGDWAPRGEINVDADVIIVDETSMVDVCLFARLLGAMSRNASLVLIGDPKQLPPVNPGNVFAHLIEAGVGKIVVLEEIIRQARASRIISNAHLINRGQMPDLEVRTGDTDFYWVDLVDPNQIRQMIATLLTERIPSRFGFDPIEDCQVLSPRHDGSLGTRELNIFLKNRLNPQPASVASYARRDFTYHPGDRIIQIRNCPDKGLMNGDIGRIVSMEIEKEAARIKFEDCVVDYPFCDFDELAPAYSYTLHKSQGSEFPCVILPVSSQFGFFFQRSLLYTGLTRAKKLAVLVGERAVLRRAIEKTDSARRYSGLLQRLSFL